MHSAESDSLVTTTAMQDVQRNSRRSAPPYHKIIESHDAQVT
jgi:hypothetical protein